MAKIPFDDKYFDLLARTLSGSLYPESAWRLSSVSRGVFTRALTSLIEKWGYLLVKPIPYDASKREYGEDWPMIGYTMAGHKRLANIRQLISSVVAKDIRGDFVECGVWRGGSSIYAKAVLDALGSDRAVWCCDSFAGMPEKRADDGRDTALAGNAYLRASVDDVRANFGRFELLDERVHFVKGWFSESLPNAPIDRISVLRLDGDYYSSTMDALTALYGKVSAGGFVIVDDYHVFEGCKRAITEFRRDNNISSELVPIDDSAVYWQV